MAERARAQRRVQLQELRDAHAQCCDAQAVGDLEAELHWLNVMKSHFAGMRTEERFARMIRSLRLQLHLQDGEDKAAFLGRAEAALLALAPNKTRGRR